MQAIDSRITFGMFMKNLGDKLKGIMAKSMSPEEKLNLILQEMGKDVQQKKIMARDIRVKMVALADPDTQELEPIERMKARRAKLVQLGQSATKAKQEAGSDDVIKAKDAEIKKLAQEIKTLDTSLNSLEQTYDTLKESYELALDNYKVAQAAYDHAKNNGESLLFAIKAHQDALSMRDNAKTSKKSDTSFLNDLEGELSKSQRELRSDKTIDAELETENPDIEEDNSANESILAEFEAKK